LCWFIKVEYPGFFLGSEGGINFQKDRFLLFRSSTGCTWKQQIYPSEVGVDATVTVRINDLGFRDRIYVREKPRDTYRIICLGDSNTFGVGVEANQTFSKRLEETLQNVAGSRFEVMNAGIPGYSSVLGLELFRRELIHYQPDCIIIGFASNDSFTQLLGDYGSYTDRGLIERLSSERGNGLYHLFRPIRNTSLYKVTRHAYMAARHRIVDGGRDKKVRVPLDEYRRNLISISETCIRRGGEIIFVCVGPEKRISPYREVMKQVAADYEKAFIDVNELLKLNIERIKSDLRFLSEVNHYKKILGDNYAKMACGESLLYATVDCEHPNAIGHKLIEDKLIGILCDKGIVRSDDICPRRE